MLHVFDCLNVFTSYKQSEHGRYSKLQGLNVF